MSDPHVVRRVRVARTVLEARAARPAWISWPRRADPFLADRGADIRVTVRRDIPPPPGEMLFDSGGVWRAHRQPDGRLLFTFRVGRAIYKAALLDPAIEQGEIFFPPRPDGLRSAMQFPLDELLFQQRWARDGRIEVHACAVRERGRVLLFAGHSGAGKSTTAKLWTRFSKHGSVLSDDRVVLDPRGRRPIPAFGTPWHGTGRFGSPESGPLAALFFLEQAVSTEAIPVSPGEAAARLFTRTFPPIWEAEGTGRVMEGCARVAESVPAFVLRFRKDESAVVAARRAVGDPLNYPWQR